MLVAAAGGPAGSAAAGGDAGSARHEFLRDVEGLMPNLRRYARSLARDADEADDIVQDALVAALGKIHQFEPGTNLRAWLFTITRNSFLDRRRRGRVRAHVPLDDTAIELQARRPRRRASPAATSPPPTSSCPGRIARWWPWWCSRA